MARPLPDAELDVLSSLWRLKVATAKELRIELESTRPLNHASVCTLLRRLEKRGLVDREKRDDSREYVYRALARPDGTRRSLVRELVERAFDGSGVELVNALLQTQPPSLEEIEQLQAMLDELRAKTKTKKKRRRRDV